MSQKNQNVRYERQDEIDQLEAKVKMFQEYNAAIPKEISTTLKSLYDAKALIAKAHQEAAQKTASDLKKSSEPADNDLDAQIAALQAKKAEQAKAKLVGNIATKGEPDKDGFKEVTSSTLKKEKKQKMNSGRSVYETSKLRPKAPKANAWQDLDTERIEVYDTKFKTPKYLIPQINESTKMACLAQYAESDAYTGYMRNPIGFKSVEQIDNTIAALELLKEELAELE